MELSTLLLERFLPEALAPLAGENAAACTRPYQLLKCPY